MMKEIRYLFINMACMFAIVGTLGMVRYNISYTMFIIGFIISAPAMIYFTLSTFFSLMRFCTQR